MSTQFVVPGSDDSDEFTVQAKVAGMRQKIKVKHQREDEKVDELEQEIFKYGLEPAECFTIKNSSSNPVTVVKKQNDTDLTLKLRANTDGTNPIKIISVSSNGARKIYSTFTINVKISTVVFADLAKWLINVANEAGNFYANSIDPYSKICGVWIDPNNSSKMVLKQLYPVIQPNNLGVYMDPDHFTDYYMLDKKYLLFRPLLVIKTKSRINDLVVLHAANTISRTDFWSNFGAAMTTFDLRRIESLFLSKDAEHLYYIPAVMRLMVNEWLNRATNSLVGKSFAQMQNLRKDSVISAQIRTNPVMLQIFSNFMLGYGELHANEGLGVFDIFQLFGVKTQTFRGYNAACSDFFKAVMLHAYNYTDKNRPYNRRLFPRVNKVTFLRARFHSESMMDFIGKQLTLPFVNVGASQLKQVDHIVQPNRTVYCPFTHKKLTHVVIIKVSGEGLSSPVLVQLFKNKKSLALAFLKTVNPPECFYREYSVSVGLRMMDSIFRGQKDLSAYHQEVSVNTYKVVPLDTTFGIIESVGGASDAECFPMGEYKQSLDDIYGVSPLSPPIYPKDNYQLTIVDDFFNERLLATGIGCAVASVKCRIGDRHLYNTLIRSNGDVYPIDFGDTWSPKAMFCTRFINTTKRYYNQWRYDHMYRMFDDVFHKIDIERARMLRGGNLNATAKNYQATFRALYKKAFILVSDAKLAKIRGIIDLVGPSDEKPLYQRRLNDADHIYLGAANIQTLFDEFKIAMAASTSNLALPNSALRFKNFTWGNLSYNF